VSNIPSSALFTAMTPVQRAAHDAPRARQIQSAKNSHHQQDVEELDDTAVNSVRDEAQQRHQHGNGQPHRRPPEEQLDLQSLPEAAATAAPASPASETPHLDISA
jgi:hypothetical protein